MTLWLIFALMTAVAALAVLWPLYRRRRTARSGNDLEVYRDQLAEIERDKESGLVGSLEAEAARVEVSRRLLAAADVAEAHSSVSPMTSMAWHRRAVTVIALLLLFVGSGGLYLRLGSPGLASEPFASRLDAPSNQQSVEALVVKVEAHLQQNPDDGRGWEVLAPVYMRLGRYTDAVNAWRNALRLLGESAEREADLGEALVAAANGIVTADAKAAFVRAAALDANSVSARYYLGLAAEQDGQRDQAIKIWRDLIATAPAGAHWVSNVREAIARVEGKPAATASGPTAAQMAAAGNQPPAQQAATIRSMVDRLAARLKQDGSDLDGWVRLVRSYKVLGESDKANTAAAAARQALAGDPGKLQQLNAALKELDAGSAAVPAPAPTPAQMATANAPSDHQQGAMIQDMVAKLAERLKKSGSDPEGWLMLTRSYLTLGEKEKATAAVSDARHALAGDPDKLEQFNEALKQFKIGE
jgi:cytochrome c-type biogenesis protein CcmH